MSLYVSFDCESCENENCTGKGLKPTVYKCDGYKHTQTNADRIRSLSDEELADFLCKVAYNTTPVGYYHIEGWLNWLKEEAKGET